MPIRARAAAALVAFILVGAPTVAAAQSDPVAETPEVATAVVSPPLDAAAIARAIRFEPDQRPGLERPRAAGVAPSSVVLASLYASTAVMQGLDVHSTLRGLDRGASEVNPLMRGLVKHRGAFIATKAVVGVGTILATRQLARKHRIAAVVTLVALNAAYGAIVHHNYRVAAGLR
jgi:hypothetical protein